MNININQLVRHQGGFYVPTKESGHRGLQIQQLVLLEDYLDESEDPDVIYQASYDGTASYIASTKVDAINGWMVVQLQHLDFSKVPVPFFAIGKQLDPVATSLALSAGRYISYYE